MKRRALICAGVLPAALPLAAMAFGFEPAPAAPGCATAGALREAHDRHALSAPQRKMMEEGAICPICGCPPGVPAQPGKLRG
jgi:hypothetical protein